MTPFLTALSESKSIAAAAELMETQGVGSIIVSNEDGSPVGIVTERDIVTRVVAKHRDPTRTLLHEIASKPLIMIDSTADITTAMRLMSQHRVRHLVVKVNGKATGMLTDRDILTSVPDLIEIDEEFLKIYSKGEGD